MSKLCSQLLKELITVIITGSNDNVLSSLLQKLFDLGLAEEINFAGESRYKKDKVYNYLNYFFQVSLLPLLLLKSVYSV